MVIRDVNVYLTNASAMWRTLAPDTLSHADYLRVELPGVTRLMLKCPTAPDVVSSLLDDASKFKAVVVEDVFSADAVPMSTPAVRVLRMPVMIRPAATVTSTLPVGVRVVQIADSDELAQAEQVIVDGFPLPLYQPLVRSQALPPRVLGLLGWRVWLAYRGGRPAAAGYTYDDGTAVGLYWLATLPEHRSRGLARAILTTAIAAQPIRPFTLVATEAGLPLYESLGFGTVTTTTWYTRSVWASIPRRDGP